MTMSSHYFSTAVRRRLAGAALTAVLAASAVTILPAGAASLNVTFTATPVTFGTVTIGTSASSQVVVTNTSSVSLWLKSATVHGGAGGDYVDSSAGCVGAVAPGDTCTIGVAFAPQGAGARVADLAVVLGAKSKSGTFVASALDQVLLTGAGAIPTLELSDADAGTVTVGSTATADAVVANTSSVPVILESWVLSGDARHQFAVSAVTCPTPLLPGQDCDVVVAFTPAAAGAAGTTLTVTARLVGSPTHRTVSVQSTITGAGATSGSSPSPLSLSSLSFGSVTVGTSASGEVAVVNTSSNSITLTRVGLGANALKQFTLGTNGCTSALAPGDSCTIGVTYSPSVPDSHVATLAVGAKETVGSSHKALVDQTTLSGRGVRPTVALDAPDFGTVTIGASSTDQVVVSNTSLAPLSLKNAVLSGPHLPSWTVSSTTCSAPIAPGGTCEIELTFSPHTSGNLSVVLKGKFTVTAGTRSVPVNTTTTVLGLGAEPSFTVTAAALAATSASQPVSASATVTNTSGVTLSYVGAHLAGGNAGDFTVTGTTCGVQLASAGTCGVTIRFDPHQSTTGLRTTSLTVVLSVAGLSPAHHVALTVAQSATED